MRDFARMMLTLSKEEFMALRECADRDYRHPRDQARHIIRQALLASGPEKSNSSESQVLAGQGAAVANVL